MTKSKTSLLEMGHKHPRAICLAQIQGVSVSNKHTHSSDLRGVSRLMIDAIVGAIELVESVNTTILNGVTKSDSPVHKPMSLITTMVYRNIRAITGLVGNSVDALLSWLDPWLNKNSGWSGREPLLAILNGKTLALEKQALAAALPNLNGRILVLAHGLCMSDLAWQRRKHDHGAALASERNYTPVYLHYNSGLHISINGRQFAQQLELLVRNWPVAVEELVIIGHSMGGMLARSAFYYGAIERHRWQKRLRKLVFLGAPHHGAPLERGGNWFNLILDNSRYTAPFSSLGRIRSAGITDLRYGNLLDQDWERHDRFAHVGDQRQPLPLPAKVQCYTIAATLGKQAGDMRDRMLGDGLVPVESALGQHQDSRFNLDFPPNNYRIEYAMNHMDLLNRNEVYQHLLVWL
jgi:pimeloyl-ACP methyl ester carboxylesterase